MKIFFVLLVVLLCFASTAAASPIEDMVVELERSTSFHWGQDCLVWIVHYGQGVVNPWVEAEAAKANFTQSQKEEYRRAFVSELRMSEAEPFLLSVYAFGASPLLLKPFEEKIALVNSSGQRLKPISYERVFDEPIQGMVQGLVFFPKQAGSDFAIALKGLGVFDERMFQFAGRTVAAVQEAKRDELVVIDMPPASPPQPQPKPKQEPPIVIEEVPKETPPEKKPEPAPDTANLYISRERTLQLFINSWLANDTSAMYDMLSTESKKMYSRDSFDKEVKKLADIRRGMLSSYKIDWVGDERAKISTTKKLLIMRTLISKTLGVTRAGNEWRIIW